MVWVYLHSNLCSMLQKTHLFCTTERFGSSTSSKVDDFGTNRKRVCDRLPISRSLWLRSYLAPFLRYGDFYWLTIAYFPYPSLIRRPRSRCSLWNFVVKITMRKLESWGYPTVKPHYRSLRRFDKVPACVRQTSRRTALCIASYADAL